MKGKYLITTDNWFYAPDGQQYKSVWGEIHVMDDSILGVKTNARSSNWFVKIGTEENHVIIAGCQIHYSVKCNVCPNTFSVRDYTTSPFEEFERRSNIYIAI